MDYRQIIKNAFVDDENILAVIIYGSLANQAMAFNEESDIDLAFLPAGKTIDKLGLYKKLSEIDRDIDIVNLKKINPMLAMQIMKNHEIVIMKDSTAWEAWKTQMLVQYHDLQISNRNIIKDLGKYSPLET